MTCGSDVPPDDARRAEEPAQDCQHERRGGLRLELDWRGREVGGWGIEPPAIRVDARLPNRVDRLKAIGNGQVPQCAAQAWRILTHNVQGEALPIDTGATKL